MSIRNIIKTSLRKRGWIIKSVPSNDASRIDELTDLLCQDNADGRAYRHALRHWHVGERPIIERFAGHGASLDVEGPCYTADGTGYPLGSVLQLDGRSYLIHPDQTNRLADELRSAIDKILGDWTRGSVGNGSDFDIRDLRERDIDDQIALDMIASATFFPTRNEQICDDQ